MIPQNSASLLPAPKKENKQVYCVVSRESTGEGYASRILNASVRSEAGTPETGLEPGLSPDASTCSLFSENRPLTCKSSQTL